MEGKLRLNIGRSISVLIGYSFLAAVWWILRSYMLFLLMMLIPLLFLLSAFLLWRNADRISADIVLPVNRVNKNTDFPILIQVSNAGRGIGLSADLTYCYRNCFTEYEEVVKKRIWIAPSRDFECKGHMRSRYAGRMEAELVCLRLYDFFHLFSLDMQAHFVRAVFVWPTSVCDEEEPISSLVENFPEEKEMKNRGVDYNPDYEVREYIPGDELKTIHWKLSAKQDKLMVRERLAGGKESVNVLVPLGSDVDENDAFVEALYGVCLILINKAYPVRIFWPGKASLQSGYVVEYGELEQVLGEILSTGRHIEDPVRLMELEYPGQRYIRIQTGAYKGAFIR